MESLKCSIMRAGTSKGIFILENELPKDQPERDKVIQAVFGSPDKRQIDGLGGADTLTSKLAIIGEATREDADVDYTFAQVSIDQDLVDYKGNCGNISSGVGVFAIDEGLVEAVEPITTVRIHQTNTNKLLVAEIPIVNGKPAIKGDFAIDGVPGTGAKITMDFSDTQGSQTGKLLPTGNAKDQVEIDGKAYEISIVDAANPLVFIRAEDLGMSGIETPDEIDQNASLMNEIEKIRGKAAEMIGLVDEAADAAEKSPYIPFFAIVSPSADYHTYNHKDVKADEVDLVSRLLFMLKMHKTYPGTGTVCTGAAARIPGSIVWDLLKEEAKERKVLQIGHPAGIIPVEVEAETENGEIQLKRAAFYRTARKILDGTVFINQ
mgnify:CR=1 FL=1